jgi:hypothetical protein
MKKLSLAFNISVGKKIFGFIAKALIFLITGEKIFNFTCTMCGIY